MRFAVFLILLVGIVALSWAYPLDIPAIRQWLSQFPFALTAALYILIYVGVTTFIWFGTLDLFRITGALLFGPFYSTLFVYIAEVCNAAILFSLSRRMGREFIEEKFSFKDKDHRYSPQAATLWTALALRINPLVPFRFMDVGFGLTNLSLRNYVIAVIIGSPLRIFWLQFVIAGMGEAIFKDPLAMREYLQTHPVALLVSAAYLLGVVVITAGAVVVNAFKKKSA